MPTAASAEAEHHRHQNLERGLLAHADETAEGQEKHRKKLRGTELQRKLRHQRRQESDHHDGKEGADKGRRECRGQCLTGLALLGHRIAIKCGCHRPRLTGNIEQDGRDRAAEQRTPVNTRQHDHRRRRRHGEGERQKNRDTIGAAQTGQHADQHTQRDPDEHQQQVERRQRNREPVKQGIDFFQGISSPRSVFWCRQ